MPLVIWKSRKKTRPHLTLKSLLVVLHPQKLHMPGHTTFLKFTEQLTLTNHIKCTFSVQKNKQKMDVTLFVLRLESLFRRQLPMTLSHIQGEITHNLWLAIRSPPWDALCQFRKKIQESFRLTQDRRIISLREQDTFLPLYVCGGGEGVVLSCTTLDFLTT